MLIYCAHAFGGDEAKKYKAAQKIKKIQLSDLENTYISPVHAFGALYDAVPYETGMELCFDLLTACDEILVMSEVSKGVLAEIQLAQKLHMPVRFTSEQLRRRYQRNGIYNESQPP